MAWAKVLEGDVQFGNALCDRLRIHFIVSRNQLHGSWGGRNGSRLRSNQQSLWLQSRSHLQSRRSIQLLGRFRPDLQHRKRGILLEWNCCRESQVCRVRRHPTSLPLHLGLRSSVRWIVRTLRRGFQLPLPVQSREQADLLGRGGRSRHLPMHTLLVCDAVGSAESLSPWQPEYGMSVWQFQSKLGCRNGRADLIRIIDATVRCPGCVLCSGCWILTQAGSDG